MLPIKKMVFLGSFLIGLCLEFSAFLVDHAERIPFVRNVVMCELAPVERAFNQIEYAREIEPSHADFGSLTRYLTRHLHSNDALRQRGYKDVGELSSGIIRVAHRVNTESESLNIPSHIMLRASLADGGTVYINRDSLRDLINQHAATRFFMTAAFIFLLGATVQFSGFLYEFRAESK